MSEMIVQMKNINKSFSGVQVLENVQLDLYKGEVLALIGENGAGKSTLMKILTGVYTKDSGDIIYKGNKVKLKTPDDAMKLGIGIIHQELNLMQDMSVSENIYIGHEFMKGVICDKKTEYVKTQELLDILELDIKPWDIVGELTVAKQQMVEIAKALSRNSEVLIMDEPTAALTVTEIEELFRVIGDLKARGTSIIYISHRMEELFRISDRITVMRDGQYIDTKKTSETDREEIIRLMVGRTIFEESKQKSSVSADAPVVLEVDNLVAENVKHVSFRLKKGEILGFAGLMGAGRTETMRAIFGADPKSNGEIKINGNRVHIRHPYDAVRQGICYLSEDRKRYGLATGLSVRDNTAMAVLDRLTKGLFIDDKTSEAEAENYIKKLGIKTSGIRQLIRNLSGGNQQKVVIAKWLFRGCDVMIFDEPTRGIDVGAKNEIYKLMHKLVEEGKSLIVISSEMPELLRICDRIEVMCEGELSGELSIEEATQEKIMSLATAGGK